MGRRSSWTTNFVILRGLFMEGGKKYTKMIDASVACKACNIRTCVGFAI